MAGSALKPPRKSGSPGRLINIDKRLAGMSGNAGLNQGTGVAKPGTNVMRHDDTRYGGTAHPVARWGDEKLDPYKAPTERNIAPPGVEPPPAATSIKPVRTTGYLANAKPFAPQEAGKPTWGQPYGPDIVGTQQPQYELGPALTKEEWRSRAPVGSGMVTKAGDVRRHGDRSGVQLVSKGGTPITVDRNQQIAGEATDAQKQQVQESSKDSIYYNESRDPAAMESQARQLTSDIDKYARQMLDPNLSDYDRAVARDNLMKSEASLKKLKESSPMAADFANKQQAEGKESFNQYRQESMDTVHERKVQEDGNRYYDIQDQIEALNKEIQRKTYEAVNARDANEAARRQNDIIGLLQQVQQLDKEAKDLGPPPEGFVRTKSSNLAFLGAPAVAAGQSLAAPIAVGVGKAWDWLKGTDHEQLLEDAPKDLSSQVSLMGRMGIDEDTANYMYGQGWRASTDGDRLIKPDGSESFDSGEINEGKIGDSGDDDLNGIFYDGAKHAGEAKQARKEKELRDRSDALYNNAMAEYNKPVDYSEVDRYFKEQQDSIQKSAARNKALALRAAQERGAYSGASVNQMMGQSTEMSYAYDTEAQQQEAALAYQHAMARLQTDLQQKQGKLNLLTMAYQNAADTEKAVATQGAIMSLQADINKQQTIYQNMQNSGPGIGSYLLAGGIGVAGALGSVFSGGAAGVAAAGAIASILGSAGAMYNMSQGAPAQMPQIPAGAFNYGGRTAPGSAPQAQPGTAPGYINMNMYS